MNMSMSILGLILLGLSFIGCVLPVVPGPALAFLGLCVLYLTDKPPTIVMTVVAAVVTIVAIVLDYVVPSISAKQFHCSKAGVIGCAIGTVAGFVVGIVSGIFLTIIGGAVVTLIGMVAGPFLGTMTGELIAHRTMKDAFVGGVGAFIGYVISVILKIVACLVVSIQFIWILFC